jgi:isoleucyl-tRNA synthetase
VLGRAARAAANVKNRQPLARMFVQGGTLDALYTSIIADELNVKAVEFVNDASSFISYRVKPQLKTLGPRYGKLLPKINAYLAQDGIGDKVVAAHKAGNSYDFELEGTAVSLAEADVLTEPIQKAGFVSQTEKETAVVLDTNLTDELVDEGFVRELVSKIQVMRKEAGFEVTDRIALTYACAGRAKDVLSRFGDAIAQDVLAVSVECAAPAGYVKEWDVNGEKVTLGVEKK